MINECMQGNIDMVITKSISRFARNTLDCLKYIRQLKEINIPVFFEKLQQELLKKINARENYDDIADEILKLRELQQKSTLNSAARNELLNRITDLQEFIKNQSATITDFDEKLVRRLIEKIWVFDNKLVFEFKTGLTIDINN